MNRTLAIVVLWALPNGMSVGLVATSPDGSAQAQMAGVNVAQNAGEVLLEQETKTFDGETPIGIALPNGSRFSVGTGSLKSPTSITLKTFDNRPEGGAPRAHAIGLRTVVEVPISQLDLSDPMTNSLAIWAPAFDGAYERADHPVQEVAIFLDQGRKYVFLDSYIPDFAVIISPAILEVVTGVLPNSSGTLRVSVQPIDAGGVLRGTPDSNDPDNP